MKYALTHIIAMICALLLGGCGLFGAGSDDSHLEIESTCDVNLSQRAAVTGREDADVVETVTVTPACQVEIQFRQTVGDSVKKIESNGEHESAVESYEETEATTQTPAYETQATPQTDEGN